MSGFGIRCFDGMDGDAKLVAPCPTLKCITRNCEATLVMTRTQI
jgi:hypothetical protein